jgi:nucleotidyltransferase substrate binding protein (TIGR01987 family)
VTRRLALTRKALARLEEALAEPKSTIVRDASIQRFEFSFEAAWKTAQRYLRDREGVEAASPAMAIRHSNRVGLLDGASARRGLAMIEDRNRTVHTYDERLADLIYERLRSHAELIGAWLQAMERRLES